MSEQMHQIGHVASTVGLSLRTVRYYEEVGLAPPSGRTEGGFRLYTDEDIARLELVKQLKPLEFTLEELRDLLQANDTLASSRATAKQRAAAADRLAGYAQVARQRCELLREQLEAVEAVTARLAAQAKQPASARQR